jgi:glycerate 2-kinase
MREIWIKNKASLLSVGTKRERKIILDCVEAGLNSVHPHNLLRNKLKLRRGRLHVIPSKQSFDLSKYENIIVVGGGKASGALAQELERILKERINAGSVNILEGTKTLFRTKRIKLNEASHPIPDRSGVEGTERILQILKSRSTPRSLVICLISGGGSALFESPGEGITLQNMIETTNLLLKSGATIDQVNCVRKHISKVKGGQLVGFTRGATVLSLIISDVVGDHLESIASGLTYPDPTTFSDAKEILERFNIFGAVPSAVRERIENGIQGKIEETPKPNDPRFSRVSNVIVGSNRIACEEICSRLKKRFPKSLDVTYLGSSVTGEASLVAADLVRRSIETLSKSKKKSSALVWGGETTVTVKGNGTGGRNQEEALSALITLAKIRDKTKAVFCFAGTDGIDGKTDAAGAIVDHSSFEKATKMNLDSAQFMKRNDSNTFFQKLGNSLVVTGATGTNVNDIGMAIITKS